MIDIEFKKDVLYYKGIPLNLYGVLGLFKMFNHAFNPSVWSSGLNEMGVGYDVKYSVGLSIGDTRISFNTEDLIDIQKWLKENNKEWYETLPDIQYTTGALWN